MRGLVHLTASTIEDYGYSPFALKSLLTLSNEGYGGKVSRHESFVATDKGMFVPRAFLDFQFYKPSDGEAGTPLQYDGDSYMALRDYQREAVDAIKRATLRDGGALLVGGCGTGKTVMGCFLIREIGVRTLVLVHKEFLLEQFKSTLEQAFPSISISIWQKDKTPTGDEDVVISMVQSLGARDYPDEMYKGFGLILTDEVHRFSAPQWSEAMSNFGARYRIGLTATPERVDGLQSVFMNAIGPIAHTVQGNLLKPTIYPIETNRSYAQKDYSQWDGQVSTSKLISLIGEDDFRSREIIDYAVRATKRGRHALILTDRRSHVDYMVHIASNLLGKDYKVFPYIGGMKKASRKEAEDHADLLVGTYSMAQEGLDIPRLDTLIFASPKTNVVQAVGRILRPSTHKQSPVVLDFIDEVPILRGYYKKRRRQYEKEQYLIKGISKL
jgi:superfamily II DNA or RNA helicase